MYAFVLSWIRDSWWRHQTETFPRFWPFVMESSRHRLIPITKANEAELWCFLWSVLEQTVEKTIGTPVIWVVIALIMTSLWCACIFTTVVWCWVFPILCVTFFSTNTLYGAHEWANYIWKKNNETWKINLYVKSFLLVNDLKCIISPQYCLS